MLAIFTDLVEDIMEVYMDDFSVYGNSCDFCFRNLKRVLQWCEETNLALSWEKFHLMVSEETVLGHKFLAKGSKWTKQSSRQ